MATLPKRGEMACVNSAKNVAVFLLPRFPSSFKDYFEMTADQVVFALDHEDLMTILDNREHTEEEKHADNMWEDWSGFNTWSKVFLTDGRIGWVMAKYLESVTK